MMGSIVVGIWALVSALGFMNGFMVGYMADIINHDISNIQIHHPEFKTDFDVKFYIPDGAGKVGEIRSWSGVQAATTRTLTNGMVASPRKAAGVQIRGIDPQNEAAVTGLDSLLVEGAYLGEEGRNPIIIGSKLAETLGVKDRSKVVLTFNDAHGNITSAAFRISGIVKSSSLNINEGYAFIRQSDLDRLLDLEGQVHEIAVLTEAQYDENLILTAYKDQYPSDLVETWREIAPELALLQEMYGSMLYVLMVIIMLALVFGIVNTMLMAVLERTKELGMLMAVGMNKTRVFAMVLLETLFIGIISAPFGMLAGSLTIRYFTLNGLDLSAYSEGLESFGYNSILYPYIENQAYFTIAMGVIITSFIGAVYPAWKAVKLKPVEALHTI